MEFKKFSAGLLAYGTGNQPTVKQEANVCFHDPRLIPSLYGENANAE